MLHEVLALDRAGAPSRWMSVPDAAFYYAKGQVLGECGEHSVELRGGHSALTGSRSILSVNSIVLIRGERVQDEAYKRGPPFSRELLFLRDRHVCAYCAGRFRHGDLSIDHVRPRAYGGELCWVNTVTACRSCNGIKGARTPEQAGMPLAYVPYAPCRSEAFILANRRILADQMTLLLATVPKHSRLHS